LSEGLEDQIDRLNEVLKSVMDDINAENEEPEEFMQSMCDF
jgi:hypothetical protein